MRQRRARYAGLAAMVSVLAIGPMLTACTSSPTSADAAPVAAASTPSATRQAPPSFPIDPATKPVDVASQHKADSWLAGAAVPPDAVRSKTRPAGVADDTGTEMWCTPMADAVGYWTLPNTSAGDAIAWLRAHASQGMRVTGVIQDTQESNAEVPGGTVVDEPAPESIEALIFTVTSIGFGSGIRADAFAEARSSVCATPAPGTMLGIGG